MAIKKLQNNFTTPEQSKRLLELGVPADSADCHYINSDRLREDNRGYIFVTATDAVDFNKPIIKRSKQKFYIPCWSVGRLIEIVGIISGAPCINNVSTNNIICHLLDIFDIKADHGTLNFSKLDD